MWQLYNKNLSYKNVTVNLWHDTNCAKQCFDFLIKCSGDFVLYVGKEKNQR